MYSDLGHVLNSGKKELITSITSGGAFIGAIVIGMSTDRFDRKVTIHSECILFIVRAILQATAFTSAQMTVGRPVVGFDVGSAAMIVPVYNSVTRNSWTKLHKVHKLYIVEVAPA